MFELPKLNYPKNALTPAMSEETLDLHHGKHHQTYITNLNNLIKETPLAKNSLEEIVKQTAKDASKAAIFNNAGQHWNHILFWNCMKPKGGGAMPSTLEKRIIADFGSVEKFKEDFIQAGITQFGSGWAWLCTDDQGGLFITSTPNQDNPLMDVADKKGSPILCLDVWEHAYYLNYQNRRPDYISAWWNVVNWKEVARRYK